MLSEDAALSESEGRAPPRRAGALRGSVQNKFPEVYLTVNYGAGELCPIRTTSRSLDFRSEGWWR